jgi:glycosyltransferase involved in cell wall biosynthesis
MSFAVSSYPAVDVNLFVHNGEAVVGAAIESVLAQTWPVLNVTLIDDGSSDGTAVILAKYATRAPTIKIRRLRCNGGSVAAFQRAFWSGDADFVMPKSGDDPVAPDFVEKIMDVLLSHPECAMCHAAGLVFSGDAVVRGLYPAQHRLSAVGPDPVTRAIAVMRTYTSSPSFWGIYRRSAVDRLASIAYRAGWDHVLLAELALYGEIRHVPEVLYWRRDGGRPIADLARRATLAANRGLPLDTPLAEQRWRTPLITTAYAHLENFSVARVDSESRAKLMTIVPEVFRRRWLPALNAEASTLRGAVPALLAAVKEAGPCLGGWAAHQVAQALQAAQSILPNEDFSGALSEIALLVGNMRPHMYSSAG